MTTTAETTDMQSLLAFARDRGACAEARLWLNTQTDPHVAWEMCERPDWMIWFARRRSVERKVLVRIACDCARTALRFVPEGEDRPRLAIEAAERWTLGEATIDEVRVAAAYAAAARAALYAADAAADAAANAAAYAADTAILRPRDAFLGASNVTTVSPETQNSWNLNDLCRRIWRPMSRVVLMDTHMAAISKGLQCELRIR
jgi:hypothetical protein